MQKNFGPDKKYESILREEILAGIAFGGHDPSTNFDDAIWQIKKSRDFDGWEKKVNFSTY